MMDNFLPGLRASLRYVLGTIAAVVVAAFVLGTCWQRHSEAALTAKLAATSAQRDTIARERVGLQQDSAALARLLAAEQALTIAATARADSLERTRTTLRAQVRIADAGHVQLASDSVPTAVPAPVVRLLVQDDSTIAALDSANAAARAQLAVQDLDRANTARLRALDAQTIANLTSENAALKAAKVPRFGFRAGLITGAGSVLAALATFAMVLR